MQIDSTQSRIMKLVESTLQLSNLDIAAYYVLKGEKTTTLSATSKIQNDIISPALADAQVTFSRCQLFRVSNYLIFPWVIGVDNFLITYRFIGF